MSELTQEKVQLLSKLYNLKSEDSIIINGILDEQSKNSANKKEKEEKLSQTTDDKNNEVETLNNFESQATTALEQFGTFNNDSFSLLSLVGVKFSFGDQLELLRKEKDNFIETTKEKIANYEEQINTINDEITQLDDESKDIANNLANAKQQKEKLASLLDDILNNGNDSYNRGYVRNILEGFNYFSQDEENSLELLILFPEQGLLEYDSKKLYESPMSFKPEEPKEIEKNIDNDEPSIIVKEEEKTIPEIVIENDKDENIVPSITPEYKEEKEEEPVIVPIITEESTDNGIFEKNNEEIKGFNDNLDGYPSFDEFLARADEQYKKQEENTESPIISPIEEPKEEPEKIISALDKKASELPEENRDRIIELIEASDANVKANYDMLKVLELTDNQIFTLQPNDYLYLTDKELVSKITLLRGNGINDKAIKEELIAGNFVSSLDEMKERLNTLKKIDNEVTENNISQIQNDLNRCEKNIDILKENGIDLEKKEIENYMYLLSNCDQIQSQINYLKDYSIKLVRKNGKYALEAFWKSPKKLAIDIDDLLEADLENLIEAYPEVLGKNCETIQRRIKYCLENDIPVVDENNQNVFYKYIYDEVDFNKSFGNVELPKIKSFEETNTTLKDEVNNDLVVELNNYYNDEKDQDIELDEDAFKKLDSIINDITSTIKCNLDDLTYKNDEMIISKNKIERNAAVLVSALSKQDKKIDGLEKEIIIVAALYNTRLPLDQIKKIIKTAIGSKGEMSLWCT